MFLPQTTLDAITNPVILKNENGVVISCNKSFLHLHNRPSTSIIGFTTYDYLSRKEADYHVEVDKALFEAEDEFIEYAYFEINESKPMPSRSIHKSIVRNPADGSRQILAIIGELIVQSSPLPKGRSLSPREQTVLRLLTGGSSRKQIGGLLQISHHTVDDHCKSIYLKLGVKSRTEAQMIAITKLGISPHRK